MKRPDLNGLPADVMAYIEYLESRLHINTPESFQAKRPVIPAAPPEGPLQAEPPTDISLLTVSHSGLAKRTFRHQFSLQHRAGMGVFDIDVNPPDYPACLVCLPPEKMALVFTNKAHVYRIPVDSLSPSKELREKGHPIFERIQLDQDEHVVFILPERAQGYVAMLSQYGKVRILRHHLFGEHMRPGASMYNLAEFGPLVAGCWTSGDDDLFILTKTGLAIRFNEKQIAPQGSSGIRVSDKDMAISITSFKEEDARVFMIGADGKGTIRNMSSFAANKSAGGSGKIAIKNDQLVAAMSVKPGETIFLISRLGKIIRFFADEVPETDGSIQGVVCMSLRADEIVAATIGSPIA